MPRLSILGAAAARAFGLAGRPSFIRIDYAVVGGGGLSGYPLASGGGGEALFGNMIASTTKSLSASVGGIAASSTFNGVTARPGHQGGNIAFEWGGTGGTGGNSGNGRPGGNGIAVWYSGPWAYAAGGAAGSDQSGGDAYTDAPGAYQTYGGKGGDGSLWSIDGKRYGAGGGGLINDPTAGNRQGEPGLGWGNLGSSGMTGGVIISYAHPTQLFTVGAVTSTGTGTSKRWFHTLTSSQTLVPIN